VWLLERVLEAEPGVQHVTVSYATGRATLRWDPERSSSARLLGVAATLGYSARPLDAPSPGDPDLLLRLGVATFCAVNAMAMSAALYTGWGPGMAPRFQVLFRWLTLLFATPVVTWSAVPFYHRAMTGLRSGMLHVDVPITIAVVGLYVHGLWATTSGTEAYLDSVTMVVALLLVARVVESRGRARATEAATAMAAKIPVNARIIRPDGEAVVPSESLLVGDVVVLAPGDEVPADVRVLSGAGSADMSLVTGESTLVARGAGDPVLAGAGWVEGVAEAVVERCGGQTVVNRMAAGLQEALSRPPRVTVADRIAPWFTLTTLSAAALAVGLAPSGDEALLRGVAVLVVACPCALSLARPLCGAVGLGTAARSGVLFRSVDALFSAARVTEVVVDKTGTITGGRPDLIEGDEATLRLAVAVERASRHPVAESVRAAARARGVPVPQASALEELASGGVQGRVDGELTRVVPNGPGIASVQVRRGDWQTVGDLRFEDRLRPTTGAAVRQLLNMRLPVTLLTGDHREVAEAIAVQAGIQEVHAALRPDDKADWVTARQRTGERILFVGDGNNDANAIAVAEVGVAVVGGASPALLAADAITGTGIAPIPSVLRLTRRVRRAAIFTLIGSLVYNAVTVGCAVAGWINPLLAALLMPASSLTVVGVALTVGRSK